MACTGRALKPCQLDREQWYPPSRNPWPLKLCTSTTDAAAWTELHWEHAPIQVPGCRVCLAVRAVLDGSSEQTCGRCTQAGELLHLEREFSEELIRLGSIHQEYSPRVVVDGVKSSHKWCSPGLRAGASSV